MVYNEDMVQKKMTPDMVEEARRLREKGQTYKAIGQRIGVTRETVRYALNPDARIKQAEYREEHREKKRRYDAEYRKRNKDILREKKKRYRHENIEKNRKWQRSYYWRHRAEILKKKERYREIHREERRKKSRIYDREHAPEHNVRTAERRARQKQSEVELTPEEKAEIKALYKRAKEAPRVRCYLCGRLIPKGHRHVDHIVPLAKGGKHVPSNLAIVCDRCNMHKHTKLPQEVGLLL